jgi:hypothetical protein
LITAHLEHRVAMLRREAQQHQRHAEIVVQVALGGEHGVGTGMRADDCRQHLLQRRLAVASGHADHDGIQPPAPPRPETSERKTWIRDDEQRRIRCLHAGGIAHDRAGGTRGQCAIDVVVAVDPLTGQRDEEITRLHPAAVDDDTAHFGIGASPASVQRGRGVDEAKHGPLPARDPTRALCGRPADRRTEGGDR